jgi:ectoine hydroxylase-related dioxygenase (phytanoyl-CoA dioxygenase family)
MTFVDSKSNPNWLNDALNSLEFLGYSIVTNVFDRPFLAETQEKMYSAQAKIEAEIGKERLKTAGELGVLRLMMKYEPFFLKFLENPQLLSIVDATLTNTAILHLQNGFVLPSFAKTNTPEVFQNKFHQDFKRVFNGYLASINILISVTEFNEETGGTMVVPGTHQKHETPSVAFMEANAMPVTAPPGSMIIFDSTLWHAAGRNVSGKDRLGINHQFTRSFFKQQVDYVRALGDEQVQAQVDRTQQILGWYTRVVTSLDEYYQPVEKRLYRGNQG